MYRQLWGFSSQNRRTETENYIYIGGNTGTIWAAMLASSQHNFLAAANDVCRASESTV
jgi:hypothetical protein